MDKTLIDNEYQFGSNYPGQHVLNFNNENFVLTLKKDINLLKINTNGSILWERPIIDNEDNYTANNIISTDENIYVIGNHRDNNFDVLILKLDNEGNVIWERTFGGSDYDDVFSIVEVNNFLYLVGVSYSFDGGAISDGNNGKEDLLVLKIDKEGNVIWDRTLGGSNSDGSFSILQSNENIWITGFTESNDFDIKSQNKGGSDLWIIRLNQSGEFN